MNSYGSTDIQMFREIRQKNERKSRIKQLLKQKAWQVFDLELQNQQEAKRKILKSDALDLFEKGDLQFEALVFWDETIEGILKSQDKLTYELLMILSYLQEWGCLSQQSQDRISKFILDEQILDHKNDIFILEAIQLLINFGHRFEEMFVMEFVLRLIKNRNTYLLFRRILEDNQLIFTKMTEEIRFFIQSIFKYPSQEFQERLIQVIVKQRPKLVDQDRSLFRLNVDESDEIDESDEQQE